MTDCRAYHALIEKYLAGEIGPAEVDLLLAHTADCQGCREVLELHGRLTRAGADIPEPTAAELSSMRQRVMADIGAGQSRRDDRRLGSVLRDLLRAQPVAVPALLAAVLVIAVLAGRWSASSSGSDPGLLLQAATPQELQRAAERAAVRFADEAARQPGLDGFWDAPYMFANVAVRTRNDGDLDLSFDICRHVDLVTSPTSALAREVLLNAILTSPSLGTRLRAVALSPELDDTRLRDALIHAMHDDPDLAVRLKALEVLSGNPDDEPVRTALLTTLRDDEAVQMRLLALESLVGRQVDPALIRQAIDAVDQDSDAAVLQHAVLLQEEL